MTDIKNTHSIPSASTPKKKIKIKIKRLSQDMFVTNRRSQRRSRNVLPSIRSNLTTPMSVHENDSDHASTFDASDNQQPDRPCSSGLTNKPVFNTLTTPTTKSASYWTVTDRRPEWYKLSIPINHTVINSNKNAMVPYRKVQNRFGKNQSKSNNCDDIAVPSDPTQIVMKTVINELDYDMDDNDVKFLHELNHKNKSEGKRQTTEDDFENAIIILEFATAEKVRAHLKHRSCEDASIVCDICLLPDGDEENEMVFCERCNCCVHQKCYGISTVPSDGWLCKACAILRRPSCILCPKLGGPMKCTASGTVWCHLTCALWLPELKFVDYTHMEPILNLHKIPHGRWSLRCVVCSTTEGACVQCAHKNCRTPFHVTCGLTAGYFLDIQQTPSKDSTTVHSQFNCYCAKHSDEARKRSRHESSTSSTNSDSDEDSTCSSLLASKLPLTIYRRDQLRSEQWLHDCYKRFTTLIAPSHLFEEYPEQYDEITSRKIYEYWVNKRQMNKAMPLIKPIGYVLEQRESAEFLLAQIETCLQTRRKLLQLTARSKSKLDSPSSSSSFIQRLESLKKTFSRSLQPRQRGRGRPRRLHSSSMLHPLHGTNKHKNENNIKSFKKRQRRVFYSTEQYETIEKAKRCVVSLESTYRHALELNMTYLIGKTIEGQTFLLPKRLVEQNNANIIVDNAALEQQEGNNRLSTSYSDISNDDDDDHDDDDDDDGDNTGIIRRQGSFKSTGTAYTSQGNVVTCTTGSFD